MDDRFDRASAPHARKGSTRDHHEFGRRIDMSRALTSIAASPDEVGGERPGDDIVVFPDAVMDRALTLAAPSEQVWPWLVQLGKRRAGWYLPRSVERFIPQPRRAARNIDQRWQELVVGDVIPDYGGRDASFEVAAIEAPRSLVYISTRGRVNISWSLTLTSVGSGSRLHLRLRLGPVRRPWLANSAGDLLDAVTILGMAAGLRERLAEERVHA